MALTRGLGCLEERCNSLFFFLNEIIIYQQQQQQQQQKRVPWRLLKAVLTISMELVYKFH